MDRRFVILFAVILVSGCANPLNGNSNNNDNGNTGPINSGPEGHGLEITRFDVVDNTIGTGERSVIILNLKNYHTEAENLDIKEISLYNTGNLNTEKQGCTPQIGNLESAREGFQPEMECRWEVEAPENIGGFDEKPVSLNLLLKYNSTLRTSKPVLVNFKPFDEINSTTTASHSEDNGEVKVQLETETPIPVEGSKSIDIKASSVGNGRVTSNYNFDFTPGSVFKDCDDDIESTDKVEKKPVVDNEVTLACTLDSDTANNRRLYVSTYYKYIKEPSLSITLVNQE